MIHPEQLAMEQRLERAYSEYWGKLRSVPRAWFTAETFAAERAAFQRELEQINTELAAYLPRAEEFEARASWEQKLKVYETLSDALSGKSGDAGVSEYGEGSEGGPTVVSGGNPSILKLPEGW